MAQQKTMTINEACAASGFCRQTVYNLVRDRIVASRKLGWQHFVDRASFAKYCASRGRALKIAEDSRGKKPVAA